MVGAHRCPTVVSVAVLLAIAGCSPGQPQRGQPERGEPRPGNVSAKSDPVEGSESPPHPAAPSAAAADGLLSAHVGFSLLRTLAEQPQDRILISPHSVASALLLTWNGAGGDTRTAMGKTLGLEPDAESDDLNAAWRALDESLLKGQAGLELSLANSLWLRDDSELLAKYLDRARAAYGAEVQNLDFNAPDAADVINQWVEESTGGKIDSIVPSPIPENVMLYVINAIHFKGEWTDKFVQSDTKPREFFPADGQPLSVPMMHRFGTWTYIAKDELQAVRLPYGKGQFAMYVVLPATGTLDAWMSDLNARSWAGLVASMTEADGRIILPRFCFEYDAKLRAPLSDLGMQVAFSNQADFSNLTNKRVAISQVFHKASIEVNEAGSEAAAAGAVEAEDEAVVERPKPFEFLVNRPFFFAIRHEESGALLFVSIVRSLASAEG